MSVGGADPRTVVVAGGSGQVGEGIVRAFLRNGDDVIVPTRSDPATVRALFSDHPSLRVVEADVGTIEGSQSFSGDLLASGRTPDAVVAALGGWWSGPDVLDVKKSVWDGVMDQGPDAHFALAAGLAAAVVDGGGSYILINGGAALEPVSGSGLVSVSAAAQLMLARVLAYETRDLPGRVVAVVAQTPVKSRNRQSGPDSWLSASDVGDVCVKIASGTETESVVMLHDRTVARRFIEGNGSTT